jgi:hypothetical protein
MIFDDPQDYDPLEQIELKANPPATSVGKPLILTAALAVGGFALTASAIVGGSLAALPAYFLLKRLNRSWKNHVFLRRFPGCYAHLIRDDLDMVEWIEAHGRDDVADQLRVALMQRQRLTPCANRTAHILIKPEALPQNSVVAYLSAIDQDETAETTANTESGNPKSSSGSSAEAETPTEQASPEIAQRQDERSLFVHLADNPFLCWFILASQRTGKTSSAAAASLVVKREHSTEVYYINLSDHGQGNREAFAHADKVAIGNINGGDPNAVAQLVQAAIACVEQFHQSHNAILVVDEWVSLATKGRDILDEFWDVLAPKADALSSNGIGCGRSVWAIAPRFQAATMREDAKIVKNFKPLLLAIAPGQTVEWQNPRNGTTAKLTYNGALVGQAIKNWPEAGITEPTAAAARQWQREGSSRIFWSDGQWSALGQAPALPTPPPPRELAYAVVTTAPTIEAVEIEPELPAWMQAVAASAVTSAFYQATADPIEFAIMNYFRNRPNQPKAARDILASRIKALEGLKSGEIRDYLECLAHEGKLIQDGVTFRFAEC